MEPTLLIIDDSPTSRSEIRQILRQGGICREFHEAADGISGLKMALAQSVDLILCDLEMPGMDGFKFLAMKNSREELRDVPVIILTSHEKQETKIRGLEQGASDYLTKPFDSGELIARVRVQLKIKNLQDELRKSNELLRQLAVTDPLTQLANRRSLMETLGREFERAKRLQSSLAVIMVDIDHFKRVNDTFGHQDGDRVLISVGQLLARQLRPYDMAARYGGEEFALILPDANGRSAGQVAERLRSLISELTFGGTLSRLKVTASFGIAALPSSRIHSLDDLIREADEALYRAKREGRNRVVLGGE